MSSIPYKLRPVLAGNGTLDADEFMYALSDMGLEQQEIEACFMMMDANGDGEIRCGGCPGWCRLSWAVCSQQEFSEAYPKFLQQQQSAKA